MRVLKDRGGRREGFTLLELIIVLAVLVALAGLAVAKLDLLQLKAEKATAGMDMRHISRLIQTYRATSNFYPDRWDSLLHTDGTMQPPGLPGTGVAGLDPGIVGGNGFTAKLTTTTLTADHVKSLSRLGITTVYDHAGAQVVPYGDHFTQRRVLAAGDRVVTVASTKIINAIYPTPPPVTTDDPVGGVPTNRILVVLGLGKWTTIVGANDGNAVISEPPVYPYSNELYYNRYLAVFEAYNDGSRCRLVAVLGADGDLAAEELAEFSKS